MLAAKYVSKSIALSYYVNLSANAWPWPIKLSTSELRGLIEGFSDEKLAEFIAGEIDGDGAVWFGYKGVSVEIAACKNCQKSFNPRCAEGGDYREVYHQPHVLNQNS